MKYRSDDEIEHAARSLRIRLSIDEEDRPNMAEALAKAKALGIIKDYVQLDTLPNAPGAEAKFDPSEGKIFITKRAYIAAKNNSPRARYTVAHELGHQELDHTRTRYRTFQSRTASGRVASSTEIRDESDANRYAAAFLCPYDFAWANFPKARK
jgi:Zn-dependent peptidase ImmA (M78 family)